MVTLGGHTHQDEDLAEADEGGAELGHQETPQEEVTLPLAPQLGGTREDTGDTEGWGGHWEEHKGTGSHEDTEVTQGHGVIGG